MSYEDKKFYRALPGLKAEEVLRGAAYAASADPKSFEVFLLIHCAKDKAPACMVYGAATDKEVSELLEAGYSLSLIGE